MTNNQRRREFTLIAAAWLLALALVVIVVFKIRMLSKRSQVPFTEQKLPGLLAIALCMTATPAFSQDSITTTSLRWEGFIETYYSYDLSRPADHTKADFLYSHNRHNEVAVNLVMLRVAHTGRNTRANIGFMAGTYPQYNLSHEPELLRNIYEANAGVLLWKKYRLWFDAGVLPSHIGFESAVSRHCRTLTRSLAAENSPYYETGARLSMQSSNDKWYFAGLLLNGWQRMKRVEGNNTISAGTQVTFIPNTKWLINSSTYFGSEYPDSSRRWRYFHDLYVTARPLAGFEITAGLDVGMEEEERSAGRYHAWYAPVLVAHYHQKNWALAARAELFRDRDGVIVPPVQGNPFDMQGYSLNVDRQAGEVGLIRLEGRYFRNAAPYFQRGSRLAADNFVLTASVLVHFAKAR